jgi:hypothetical protein
MKLKKKYNDHGKKKMKNKKIIKNNVAIHNTLRGEV